MADYGASDTSTTALGTNQFPISEAWTPNTGFSAVEGGTQTTDAGGKKSAPVRTEVKDGSNVVEGTTTDAAVTGDTSGSLSAKLRGLSKIVVDVWDSVNHALKVNVVNSNPNGQGTMSTSSSVAIASDQSTLPVTQKASSSVSGTLQTAQTASANGSTLNVLGMSCATWTVNMTGFTGTVNFEGSENGTNFTALSAVQLGTSTIGTSATGSTTTAITVFECAVGGLQLIQARTSSVSAGNVTVTAHAVPVTFSPRTVNANQGGTWTVQPGNTANTTAWKVDGSGVTQPVSGTFWQATQPVSGTFWQATQPVSGTVTANQGGTWTVQPGNTANTTAWKVDGSAVTQPVSGTFWQATQPVSGTFWQATQPVSGTVTANQGGAPWTNVPTAATTGGSTPSHTMSTASTNATSLKGSAGQVYGLSISNANAAARYFKLYNKASAPTVGTDTPVLTLQIPANATVIRAYPVGLALGTGIAWAATGVITDADTTAIGANDLSIDIDWK